MKMTKSEFKKSLKEGLNYPWGKASRLWNILWALLPIFGWFALASYVKKITRSIVKGNTRELPAFGKFWDNFTDGVFIFVFMIPTCMVLCILHWVPFFGDPVAAIVSIFLMPWLVINFFEKETFDSLWDVKKAFNKVFDNVKEYLFIYLLTLTYSFVYGLLSIVLVGIPGLAFGHNFYLAQFYRKYK